MIETRLYIALTSECGADAEEMLRPLAGLPVGAKVGLELFVKEGPGIVERIRNLGFPVFLDLKFHDIPYTVAGAVRAACELEPELVNVHAFGGRAMMEAAAGAASGGTRVIAVTLLTSLDADDLLLFGSGHTPMQSVESLAEAAKRSGLHGVVCSPLEAAAVRRSAGEGFMIVTPGVRPAGSPKGDQKRFMTPFQAVSAGATALVVGRPVTDAVNPAAAAEDILHEMDRASAAL